MAIAIPPRLGGSGAVSRPRVSGASDPVEVVVGLLREDGSRGSSCRHDRYLDGSGVGWPVATHGVVAGVGGVGTNVV